MTPRSHLLCFHSVKRHRARRHDHRRCGPFVRRIRRAQPTSREPALIERYRRATLAYGFRLHLLERKRS